MQRDMGLMVEDNIADVGDLPQEDIDFALILSTSLI